MNITLVRHPQTTANMAHIIYGVSDYDYTERGHNQMLWVEEYMKINYSMTKKFSENKDRFHVITSPRERASQLAKGISKALEMDYEEEELIREMNFGIFEGLTTEEAKEKFPDEYFDFQYHFDTTAIPKGESYDDFIHRVDSFIDKLGQFHMNNIYDEVVVVTHGGVIRELIERLLELEPGSSWKFSIGNGCIIKLVLKSNGFCLKELIANKF